MAEIAPICPLCSGPTQKRSGKFGPFFGCQNYPDCRGIAKAKYVKKTEVTPSPRVRFVPSAEQELIFDYVVNGTGHLLINARAGTGKSTTAREILWLLNENKPQLSVAYTSFGADAIAEFKSKATPLGVEIATTNSLGHRAITKSFKATFDNNKVYNIISEIWQPKTQNEIDIQRSLTNATKKLVELCQAYMIVNPDIDTLRELTLRHDIELSTDIEELVYDLAPKVLKIDIARPNIVSYSDQLYIPEVLNLTPMKRYDVLIIDEAQDLNKAQHYLAMRLLAPNGRLIIVGDNNQAIFGFRGSDVDSIPNLSALLAEKFPGKEIKELPLNVCRRCPKSHIRLAQEHVPEIQAMENAIEGVIEYTNLADCQYEVGDMVICRTNAPLTGIAYSLIRKGVKAVIRGRDIGQGIITLIDKLRAKSVNDLLVKLDIWVAKEIENVIGTRREDTVTQATNDKADCIRTLCEDTENIAEVKAKVVNIFQDFDAANTPRGAVVLSSIHKAKGLEADRVVFACPEIVITCEQEWSSRQETINLPYVAKTRSRHTLVFAAGAKKNKKSAAVK